MNTILKYELPHAHGPFTLPMPGGAEILKINNQADNGVMFVEVDVFEHDEEREFVSIVTGGQAPEASVYIGTYAVLSGRVAHHIYEVSRV